MAFNLKAKTIIESATLELDGAALTELAEIAPHVRTLLEYAGDSGDQALMQAASAASGLNPLLASIESLVSQGGIIEPKRRGGRPKANPTTG